MVTQEYGLYGAASIAIDPLMSKTEIPRLIYGAETLHSRSILGGENETLMDVSGSFE